MGVSMNKVQGWDTDGPTGLSYLDDGRLSLTFTGKEGLVRRIFMPSEVVAPFVATLVALNAKLSELRPSQPGADLTSHLFGLRQFDIGSNDQGTEFVLALTTDGGLQFRFQLDANATEALTSALLQTLASHGRVPALERSGGRVQ